MKPMINFDSFIYLPNLENENLSIHLIYLIAVADFKNINI